MDEKKVNGKPVTLYVEQMDFDPAWGPLAQERYADVDLEFNRENARALIQQLLHRLDKADTSFVRVRFTGRLVH